MFRQFVAGVEGVIARESFDRNESSRVVEVTSGGPGRSASPVRVNKTLAIATVSKMLASRRNFAETLGISE